MGKTLLFVLALFTMSCRVVNEENGTDGGRAPLFPGTSPFHEVDSLIQNGRQNIAVRLLRRNGPTGELRNDVLWRFVGSYHGRGMVDECISALDSLERNGWGDLTGWKVSVYDLNRDTDKALELVSPDDVLLTAWLHRRNIASMPPAGILPVPGHLGERAARLLLAAEGITPAQLQLAAGDVKYLPVTLGPRVEHEFELAAGDPGDWWDTALKTMDPLLNGDAAVRLQALRLKRLELGDYGFWSGQIGTPAGVTAAMVISSRWPDRVDWQIVDILVDAGLGQTAQMIADSRGDGVFSTGVRMAGLRKASRNSELLVLCESTPADSPEELRARAALFRARALRGLNRNDEANRAYYQFARDFPWHPTAREAAYLAGVYFDCEQNWAEAAEAYLASLRSAGTWEGDSRGHWRGGFCLYMNGRGSVGDSLWASGCGEYPYSYWRDEMLFWRARYAERQGNTASRTALLTQVAREHPWEFYGMLAAERLGLASQLELTVVSPVISCDPVLNSAAELFGRGYGAASVEMLAYGGEGDPGKKAVALGILGEHAEMISLMRRMDTEYRDAEQGILADSLIGWYFPNPYRELVEAVTDTMSVDASYVEGIMREESYFNRFVISSAGAAGLIQLMPGTAADVARWNGLPRLSPDEFFVPGNSILYGSLYINSQARRYDHPAVFLAAYNAGPGNASRWITMHGFDPSDQELYIEQITFRETRLYAKKVQCSAWIYGRIRQ